MLQYLLGDEVLNINIVAGKCSEENNRYIFDCLKTRDKSKKHIILAPDRCLFSLEQRLFEETKEECFFDVDIISLSRLSKRILSMSSNKKRVLTKQSGIALVKNLLIQNKDKLLAFRKSTDFIGFATSLFETICLFKSCNISPEDMYVSDLDNLYNLKQKDIKLIYTLYEEFLTNDYTDSFNQLALFADLITKDLFKDTIFYLVEYDDFTAIMLNIISKLARFSDGIYINCTYGKDNLNSNIYSNKVYYDLIDLFKMENLHFNILKPARFDIEYKRIIANELLAYNIYTKNIENSISINNYENIIDEVKYTLADIYSRAMLEKIDYSNFALVVPSLSNYKKRIEDEILNYNIPVYFDESRKIQDNIVIRLICDICELISTNFSLAEFTNVIKSKLLNFDVLSVSILDICLNRRGVSGIQCLDLSLTEDENIREFITLITNLRELVKLDNTWEFFVTDVIDRIYIYLLQRGNDYFASLDTLDTRLLNQVQNKYLSINEDCISVFGKHTSSFVEFIETYKTYFESTNLSLPPITSNTLFIADFETSYITNIKYLYILGCNEGKLPSYKLDNGLITDEEIAKLPNAKRINPTIHMINHRKNFKLFEMMLKPENLILSYLLTDNEGKLYPNNLICSITKLFGIEHNKASNVLNIIDQSYYKINVDNIVFNNLTPKITINNIVGMLKNWNVYEKNANYRTLLSTLYSVNKSEHLDDLISNNNAKDENINLSNVNLIKNNLTSISQIENYYSCPYKHFLNYGLRLQQSVSEKLQASDIGTIIHEVLRQVVPYILDNNQESIQEYASCTLNKVLQRDEYEALLNNPTNKFVIKSLHRELGRIIKGITHQLSVGLFKPKYFEYRFDNLEMCEGIRVKGSIDRVDTLDNKFIVIDYKTGDNQFDDYDDILSGKKLQLLIYAKAFSEKSGKIPVGAFYLPISNAFDTVGVSYQYNGIVEKSDSVITSIDMGLSQSSYKSEVLSLKTTSTGKFGDTNYYKYLCIDRNDFDFILDFAKKQVNTAIQNILNGDITPKPLKGTKSACDYCSYKALCGYLGTNDNYEQKVTSIAELRQIVGGYDGGI